LFDLPKCEVSSQAPIDPTHYEAFKIMDEGNFPLLVEKCGNDQWSIASKASDDAESGHSKWVVVDSDNGLPRIEHILGSKGGRRCDTEPYNALLLAFDKVLATHMETLSNGGTRMREELQVKSHMLEELQAKVQALVVEVQDLTAKVRVLEEIQSNENPRDKKKQKGKI